MVVLNARSIAFMPYTKSPLYSPARRVDNYSYAISNIMHHARELEAHGGTVSYLNIGDPIMHGFRPPEAIIDAEIDALRKGMVGYSPACGYPEVVETVARNAANRGIPVSPSDVIITSGASEAAELILTAILDPGDEILSPLPGYPLYQAIASKLGAKTLAYRLDAGSAWMPDFKAMERSVSPRCRMLLVINPNNPTGAVYPPEVIAQFIRIARKHRLIVVADEVYHKLLYDAVHIPVASAAGNDVPVITIDSLSKNYMAPGLRAGWLMISNSSLIPDVRSAIIRLADARLCAPGSPQFAIKAAMSMNNDYLEDILPALRARRDLTCRMINAIDGMSCGIPDGAFYVMGKINLEQFPFSSDEQFVLEVLKTKGLLFVHGSGFGSEPSGGFFRIVYLPSLPALEQMFLDLADFVKKL